MHWQRLEFRDRHWKVAVSFFGCGGTVTQWPWLIPSKKPGHCTEMLALPTGKHENVVAQPVSAMITNSRRETEYLLWGCQLVQLQCRQHAAD